MGGTIGNGIVCCRLGMLEYTGVSLERSQVVHRKGQICQANMKAIRHGSSKASIDGYQMQQQYAANHTSILSLFTARESNLDFVSA